VRYDADVVKAFMATGKGWQTRMSRVARLLAQNSFTGVVGGGSFRMISRLLRKHT